MLDVQDLEKKGYPTGLEPCDNPTMRFVAGQDIYGQDDEGVIYLVFCTKTDWFEITYIETESDVDEVLEFYDKHLAGKTYFEV